MIIKSTYQLVIGAFFVEKSMARKKERSTVKEYMLNVRMTEAEYLIIKRNADSAKMTVSEYVRKCCLGKQVVIKRDILVDMPEIREIKANLGKVGSNLNQIAKYFNQGGYRSMNMIDSIHQCMDEMHKAFVKLSELAGDKNGNY